MSTQSRQVAIVTGAAGGLGRAFAKSLVNAGYVVVLADERAEVMDVARTLGERHALGVVADVSSADDLERLVATSCARFGGIDALVNNAARWRRTPVTDPLDKALADWDHIMDTNLRGVLLLSRLCVPHQIARGGGNIVHVSTYYVLPAKHSGTNAPTWLQPADIASQLIALLAEGNTGRTGENIGAWPGQPVVLGPPRPAHRKVTG